MNDLAHVRTEALESALDDPTSAAWRAGGKVHNWKNHISDRLRGEWPSLNETVKCMLAYDAQDRADAEEWD